MKSHLFLISLAALLAAAPALRVVAQTPAATTAPVTELGAQVEFKQFIEKIGAKLQAGSRTAEALAPELKELDGIIAKYAKPVPEAAAMLTLMKARLYLEIFGQPAKAIALLKQIKADYPATKVAGNIDQVVASLERKLAAEAALGVGSVFPTFTEQDLDGKPLNLAAYKGKVVLIDFWATWCGPCVAELPNVLAAYEKFHGKGFEIIGISLDKDRAKLRAFLKERNMMWPQYFDGLGWENKVSTRYGIDSIPATFLLDGEGRIVAKNLRGEELAQKLATLLTK